MSRVEGVIEAGEGPADPSGGLKVLNGIVINLLLG